LRQNRNSVKFPQRRSSWGSRVWKFAATTLSQHARSGASASCAIRLRGSVDGTSFMASGQVPTRERGDSDGMLTKEGGERKRKEQDGYAAGTVRTVRKWAFRSAINCYGAIDHAHSSEVEFTQWRPLEKVTSVTLSLVRPGSLNPTSISAFFHLPGGATDAIGDLFELSTML